MRTLRKAYLLAIALLTLTPSAVAQSEIGILFYDLDKLYDTTPSLFYDDDDYTPDGRFRWSEERYNRKIENSSALLDSIQMPIVALYGAENEGVIRDIVEHCQEDYSYIHRTSNSLDGLDFALLYYGDRLFVDWVDLERDFMAIYATHLEQEVLIIIAKSGDNIERYLETHSSDRLVIIAGDTDSLNHKRAGLYDLLRDNASKGEGNYATSKGWRMTHSILISKEPAHHRSGVYITGWLLSADKSHPLATLKDNNYIGGYGNYLPIYSFFR